jgi:drug/metabolite transporter (DMT)-like permease
MGVERMRGKVMGMTPTARGIVEMTIAMVISGTIGWVVIRSGQPLVGLIFWSCLFGAATLLATLFLSERLTTTKPVWLAIAFAGLLLIADPERDAHDVQAGYLSGVLMALGAAFFYAIAAVVAKKLAGTPPQLIALIQVCVGILILLPFAHLTNLPTGVTAWATLVTMGVVYTGLVFALLYGAIQKLPTHLVGALSFIYPLVAIGVDYLAFGKRLQLTQLIGAIAILVSAAGTTLGWSLPKSKSPGKTAQ